MPFLTNLQEKNVVDKLTDDESALKKIFNRKKLTYHTKSVAVESYDEYSKKGWEVFSESPGGLRINMRKPKKHSIQFEDDMWCMFYNLGYRHLNIDEFLHLPHGKEPKNTKQIDVVAICPTNKIVFLTECKSSAKTNKKSFKDEIELLVSMKNGYTKSIHQIFGQEYKVKLIFATNNYRMEASDDDYKRLESADIFYINNNGFDYIKNIIKHYKHAAPYQFLGIVFRGQKIRDEPILIPALKGKMGGMEYYMFSIEPAFLLQIGFVLHRVKANEVDYPTYQRMLVPNRLKNIAAYLNEPDVKNFFPNSVIINFNVTKRVKIGFEAGHPARAMPRTKSKFGILKIPMAYAIANIIDGQHRIYGYSATELAETDTIPVVAFKEMKTDAQLKMFMDINQNQKAVSADLKLALKVDLDWSSKRVDSRMGALKAAIVTSLGDSSSSILKDRISIGEDKADLKFKPFYTALGRSLMIPIATATRFDREKSNSSLYDIANQDESNAMYESLKKIKDLINSCYEFVAEYFSDIYNQDSTENLIISNRGTYAFIMIIGSLNDFLTEKGDVSLETSNKERFSSMEKYLIALCEGINSLNAEIKKNLLKQLGQAAESMWFFTFQNIIHNRFDDYETNELKEWLQTKNKEIQERAKDLVFKIERHVKTVTISGLQSLYGDEWEIECGKVYLECMERMNQEKVGDHKNGIHDREYTWTDYFQILDYKKIIKQNWGKKPAEEADDYETFQQNFSVDLGEGVRTQTLSLAWIEKFNSYRKITAHEGTKEVGLNLKEVDLLEDICKQLTS